MNTHLCLFLGLTSVDLSPLIGVIADPFIEGKICGIEGQIKVWERHAIILQTLTFLVAAFGIVVAAMQAATGRWVRASVAALSVASSLIIAYNQNFYPADNRSFERLAKKAKYKVDQFRDEVEAFPQLDEALTKDFRRKFSVLKGEIASLEEETLKNAVTTASATTYSIPGISSAYAGGLTAEVRSPDWLKKPPQDQRNLYFVGVAEGKTIEVARSNALSSARNIALEAIAAAARKSSALNAKEEYIADFTQSVVTSAEVVSTFVARNSQTGDYRTSTLLRLPKTVAAFNAESFFVERGIPYDRGLIAGIEDNTSALTATAQQATLTERSAIDSGVVYLQIEREEDRPVAEALRQTLSKVISAPGVEKAQPAQPSNVVRYFRAEDAELAGKIGKAAEEFLSNEGYKRTLTLEDLSDTQSKGAAKQVEIWLSPMSAPAPRVYLEVEQGSSPQAVEKVKSALEAKGFTVPKVEMVTGIRSDDSRVFYYKASDSQSADSLVKLLPAVGINLSRDSATKINGPSNARAAHFDVRVGKDALRDPAF
jgi:acetolactate synthase regulatory subunit